jgi:uncharacterized protein
MARIGLISDTHGLLRPEALALLEGADYIVHGGDIGDRAILERLAAIAPLTVVRGNNDIAAWAGKIPDSALLEVGGVRIQATHDLATLRLAPGVRVVVTGHSHRPLVQERDGVLYVNPGSAGPRRFSLPISVGELVIDAGQPSARILPITPS